MKSFKQYLDEMGAGAAGGGSSGPTNSVGGGAIAGTGGKGGEPGVELRKHKKKIADPRMPMGLGKRKDF